MLFNNFVAELHPLSKLNLSVAITCIMKHSNKGVLLLVDEIMKPGGEKEDFDMINGRVSEIGKCLDTLITQFNVILTTLNMLATEKETKSGQLIRWITLTPPKLDDAISLFGDDAIYSPILRQCIADCNGHHRSLETLKGVWDEYKEKRYTYPMLIQQLGQRMDCKYSQLSISLIREALRGYTVSLEGSPDGKQTYAQYLEKVSSLSCMCTSSVFLFCLLFYLSFFSCLFIYFILGLLS
jgi:hypothetical protein